MGEPNFLNRTLFHGDNLPFLATCNWITTRPAQTAE